MLPAGHEIRDRRLAELTLQRWANQDALAVLRVLPQAKQRYGLRQPAVASVEQAIARRLLLDRRDAQRRWLDSRMDKSWPAELLELRARVAIYESDWRAVNRTIALMTPEQQGQSHWRYWRGACRAAGRPCWGGAPSVRAGPAGAQLLWLSECPAAG